MQKENPATLTKATRDDYKVALKAYHKLGRVMWMHFYCAKKIPKFTVKNVLDVV